MVGSLDQAASSRPSAEGSRAPHVLQSLGKPDSMRLQTTTTLSRDQHGEQQHQQDRQRAFDQIVSPVTSEYDAVNADGLSGEWLSLKVAQNTWENANLMRDEALKNHEYVKPAQKLNSKQQQQQQPPLSIPGASISSSHHHHHQSEDVVSTSPSSLGTPPDTCSSPVDGCGGRELAAASKCKGDSCGRGQHQQAQKKDVPVDSAQTGLDEAARTHGQGATRPSSHLDDAGPLLSKRRRVVWIEQVLLHDAETEADQAGSPPSAASTGGRDRCDDGGCFDEVMRIGKQRSRVVELEEDEGGGGGGKGRRMRRRQKSPGPHQDAAGGVFTMEELRL